MKEYIVVGAQSHCIDTDNERACALIALREAGWQRAPVYIGDADCPDSYPSGKVLDVNDGVVFGV